MFSCEICEVFKNLYYEEMYFYRLKAELNRSNISSNMLDEMLDECWINVGWMLDVN